MAKLLTASGYQGITAQEDCDLYAGLIGDDDLAYILAVGGAMEARISAATTVTVSDGEAVQHGRRVHIDAGDTEVFTIPEGVTGTLSYYIIGWRLFVDEDGTESCAPFVTKMANASATIPTGSLRDGDPEEFLSLYRVAQDGPSINQIEALALTATPIRNQLEGLGDTSMVEIGKDGGGILGWYTPSGSYNRIDSNDNAHTWIRDSANGVLTGYVRWARGSAIDLNSMISDIATANNNASAAQTTASATVTTANAAKSTAEEAKQTADAAAKTANQAKTTADGMDTRITTAQNTAKTASDAASAASKAAASAATAASNAQSTADKNKTDITSLTTWMTALDGGAKSSTSIATINKNISTNTTNISTNKTDISSLKTRVTTVENTASTNKTNITNLTTRVKALDGGTASSVTVSSLSSKVTTNTNDISTNKTNITNLTTRMTALDGGSKSGTSISTINKNISTNATNITNLTTRTSALETTATAYDNRIKACEAVGSWAGGIDLAAVAQGSKTISVIYGGGRLFTTAQVQSELGITGIDWTKVVIAVSNGDYDAAAFFPLGTSYSTKDGAWYVGLSDSSLSGTVRINYVIMLGR